MKEMTKTQIQERQLAIMNRMHEMEEKSREANNGNIILFTEAESAEYRSLVDESAGLSARAKAMASGKELEQIREREDLGKQLRERIKECSQKRENATTVLANKVTPMPVATTTPMPTSKLVV